VPILFGSILLKPLVPEAEKTIFTSMVVQKGLAQQKEEKET
jgi:hypothetical protein